MLTDDAQRDIDPTEQEPEPVMEPAEEAPPEEDAMTVLERERDQFRAMAQRAQADFVNYRRRVDEERLNLVRSASSQVVVRLLPVVDDLHRAVLAVPDDAPEGWSDGVKMILQNMRALIQAEGVNGFEPSPGDTFDPAQHEAVYYEPTVEQPAGAVVSTVRTGYRTGERVLRPAQVVVAREPDRAVPTADAGPEATEEQGNPTKGDS